jgi:hypothetical protein
MRRRILTTPPEPIPPALLDVLIEGRDCPMRQTLGIRDFGFKTTVLRMTLDELQAHYQEHRAAVRAEAKRRGIGRPWIETAGDQP